MEYFTGSFQAVGHSAIVVQQFTYAHKRERHPICLMVAAGTSGEAKRKELYALIDSLCIREPATFCRRAIRHTDAVFGKVQKRLEILQNQMDDTYLAGLLGVDDALLLFSFGASHISLCNTSYGISTMQELPFGITRARAERGIGLLLAPKFVTDVMTHDELTSVFGVTQITKASHAEKRMREMGREAMRRGAGGFSAALLEVR